MADPANTNTPNALSATTGTTELLELTARIVAAYVSNNPLPVTEVPGMIKSVHATLGGLDTADNAVKTDQKPAVAVKSSVTPGYIVCLEDGKKLKMLKRYLKANYNLTPEEYRAKWGLPANYPMVSPDYAAQRSAFAKKIGLGRNPPKTVVPMRRKVAR
ncbi:MAG: MucR family transcriptional regulator [bacterium]